jgi:hypothetical protein
MASARAVMVDWDMFPGNLNVVLMRLLLSESAEEN